MSDPSMAHVMVNFSLFAQRCYVSSDLFLDALRSYCSLYRLPKEGGCADKNFFNHDSDLCLHVAPISFKMVPFQKSRPERSTEVSLGITYGLPGH